MSEQLIPTPGVFGETGNFMLERELGQGGMGGVYVRSIGQEGKAAVKISLPDQGLSSGIGFDIKISE